MGKEELSAREEALLAEARRAAAARKASPPTAAPAQTLGAAERAAKPAPTAAERLAQLMEDERAQTLARKGKRRRYGLVISGSILALFALWVLRALRRR
jgi:hypothetical protein